MRKDLQGLRAIAIVSVLLYHFFPSIFPNGFLGVDVFFVLSGYLIFTILGRSIAKNALRPWVFADFYYKRVARILPLSVLYIITILCYAIVWFSEAQLLLVKKSAQDALLFITNIVAVQNGRNYFEVVLQDDLFTHIWSLSVEMQFYLLAPVLVVACERLYGCTTLVLAASLVAHFQFPHLLAFNFPLLRLWQFLAAVWMPLNQPASDEMEDRLVVHDVEGGTVEVEMQCKQDPKPSPAYSIMLRLLSLLSLFFLLLCLLSPFWEAPCRLLATFCTAFLIQYDDPITNSLLSHPVLVHIGDISYSLYLFHWPFAVYFAKQDLYQNRWYGILLSVGVTEIVHICYEQQYRKWSKQVLIIFMAILTASAQLLILNSPRLNELFLTPIDDMSLESLNASLTANKWVLGHIAGNQIITRCKYEWWRGINKPEISPPEGLCHMPKGDGKLNFFIIGNSYAPNHAEMIYDNFKRHISNFTIFSERMCEVLMYTRDASCHHVVDYFEVLNDYPIDVLFTVQRFYNAKQPLPPGNKTDPIFDEMQEKFDKVIPKAKKHFIMDSIPDINGHAMSRVNDLIVERTPVDEINKKLINQSDDIPARARTEKLKERCPENCHWYDIEPALRNIKGELIAYDGRSHLILFEQVAHLTPEGRRRVYPIYRDLEAKHRDELVALSSKLYP